jgi:hypothetical protein
MFFLPAWFSLAEKCLFSKNHRNWLENGRKMLSFTFIFFSKNHTSAKNQAIFAMVFCQPGLAWLEKCIFSKNHRNCLENGQKC